MSTLGYFIEAYKLFKKEHKEEIQRQKIRQELLEMPMNYNLLESFIAAFVDEGKQNMVMDIVGKDYKVHLYWDNGSLRRETRTERIMNA